MVVACHAMHTTRARRGSDDGCLLIVLGLAVVIPSGAVHAARIEDRDRAVDSALGVIERGSRILPPTVGQAPASVSRKTPSSAISPADAGATRAGRGPVGAGAGSRGIAPGGGRVSGGNAGSPPGRREVVTSQPSHGGEGVAGGGGAGGAGIDVGGTTSPSGGGTSVEVNTRTGVDARRGDTGSADLGVQTGTEGTLSTETGTPGQEPTGGGGTPGGDLGIHVEADTGGGDLNVGVQAETTETSLQTGTTVEMGTETGGTDLSGQLDVESPADSGSTTLVGSADLTEPAQIDTTTSTELDSTLAGGGDDASIDSDANEEAVGDNADDCTVLDLIACPSLL